MQLYCLLPFVVGYKRNPIICIKMHYDVNLYILNIPPSFEFPPPLLTAQILISAFFFQLSALVSCMHKTSENRG